MPDLHILYLNILGHVVRVDSHDSHCLENVRCDFSFFHCAAPPAPSPALTLHLHRQQPPRLPAAARSVLRSRECVSYDLDDVRWADYSGKGIATYDFAAETGEVFSLDDDLLHEISYIVILTRVGEMLDRRGIHRIHSAALLAHGSATLCVLPAGGGKTTLALEMIKRGDGYRLLSDEIAAIDARLRVLPFPLRVGVSPTPENVKDVPPHYLRSIMRVAHGPKALIDLAYFGSKVANDSAPLRAILFGERGTPGEPRLKPLRRPAALVQLLRHIAPAYQLPQTKAYFFRFDRRYLMRLAWILFSRAALALRIAASVQCYRFCLSENPRQNAAVLSDFLQQQKGGFAAGCEPASLS
jgi:hypothetical protein